MTEIRLHRHPLEGEPPSVHQAESIGHWLLDHYGPAMPRDRQIHVYAGVPSHETDLTGDAAALARSSEPFYTVLEAPGEAFSITALLINLAISTVISLIARSMFAPEKTLDNRTQESPNNALTSRENRVRPLERVEDIFGTVRSFPTLLMPTYDKYENHRKVEYGLYCVGRGYYEVSDVRESDTLLSAIDGSSAKVYAPFNSPNSGTHQLLIGADIIGPVVNVNRSSSVESIVLKAQNQIQLTSPNEYFIRGPGSALVIPPIPASTRDIIFQSDNGRNPNIAAVAEVGQNFTFDTGNYSTGATLPTGSVTAVASTKTYTTTVTGAFRGMVDGQPVGISGAFVDPANTGAKTVVSHTGETVTVAEALADETNTTGDVVITFTARHSGTRTIAALGNGYAELAGPDVFSPGAAIPYGQISSMSASVSNGLTDWTDWFTLPDVDRTEVWTNVLARQGMYADDGAKQAVSVGYEIQIEQLDVDLNPTGVVETISGSISGATSSERAETLEQMTAWTGPARVRARRASGFDYSFGGLVVDEITWMDLYGVSPVTKPHFGNKTIVYTVTRSTPGATSLQRRELNCLASRLLPTFDGASFTGTFDSQGAIASGTIHNTSRIVDILAAVTLDPKIGARPIDDIDVAQIWGVQQTLDAWDDEVGQFNYTFDSDGVSYEETVLAIAEAAFCKPYRQNGQIRLAVDRPQAAAVALFSHRNKKPKAETITRTFASDSDYDGVELVYVDPETEAQETIRLPLDGSYTKLKKVEISGIRSYAQAWFRANREMQRLLYERRTIETEVTTDARALLPNSRVLIVDNTRFRSWDGEVLAQDGLELTLSESVEFVPAQPHSIVLTKRDGSVQSVAVTAGSASNRVILAAPPAEAIVTESTPEGGIRTSFSFAADIARGAQAWLVDEITPTDPGYYLLRARNYAPEYYEADALAVPAKASVIN
jgi:hypothetical protein